MLSNLKRFYGKGKCLFGVLVFLIAFFVTVGAKEQKCYAYSNCIVISGDTTIDYKGKTQLTATVYDKYGRVVNKKVEWSCNGPIDYPNDEYDYDYEDYEELWYYDNPVTVSENGLVESTGFGTAKIYANAEGYQSSSVIVTVHRPTINITVKENVTDLNYGQSVQLEASVENSTVNDVKWTLEYEECNKIFGDDELDYDESYYDMQVLSIDQDGKVKAIGSGKQTVYAYVGDNAYGCIELNVNYPYIGYVEDITIKYGQRKTVDVQVFNSEYDITLTSNDESVVKISGKDIIGVGYGNAEVRISSPGCFEQEICVTVLKPYVDMSKSDITLNVSSHTSIKATKENIVTNNKIIWSSSNKNVATVNSQGYVTAIKPGTVKIYATISGTKFRGECEVYIPKPSVSLTYSRLKISMGEKRQLKSTVYNGKGKVVYKSSNTNIASVSSTGVITAKKPGKVSIIASCKIGSTTYSAKCYITVPSPKMGSSSKTMYIGTTGSSNRLYVSNAGTKKITWTSSNKNIATVNQKGELTLKKSGKVTIYATVAGKKLKCVVTVKKPYFNESNVELAYGLKKRINPCVYLSNVKWSSSNNKIATVDQYGNVTAMKPGKCKIYGTVKGCKMICNVTVKENKWTCGYIYGVDDIKLGTNSVQFKEIHVTGNKINFKVNLINRTSYAYKRFNYINVKIGKTRNTLSLNKVVYKIPVSIGSYSVKTVSFSVPLSEWHGELIDFSKDNWYVSSTTYELSSALVES